MIDITNNKFMKLAVDQTKNRIYYTMSGFWQKLSDVPNYLQDWEKAIKLVSKGFTVVADVIQMKGMVTEWTAIHEKAQKMVSDAGLSATAEIMPENVLLKTQINRIAKQSGMHKQMFSNRADAEAWLDSLAAKK